LKISVAAVLLLASASCTAQANDVVNSLLKQYEKQGGARFTASAAEALWARPFKDEKSGESRRCSQCHSEDLRRPGKHATTGKVIEPLAPSANPKRLTDPEHIEKWFLRNCKWTMGRECTPQEKGDFLLMIGSK
jgi:hypothetical protein